MGLGAGSGAGDAAGLAGLARGLQDVPVLGDHQDGDEVDHGEAEELRLLRLLQRLPLTLLRRC